MRTSIFIATLILLISCGIADAQNAGLTPKQGDDAIKQLKDQGSYESLMDAVKAAQQSNNAKASPQTPSRPELALIESKLQATFPAPADYFGHSVAIYGDEAVVGAFGRNENAEQTAWAHSLFIFQRSGANWMLETSFTSQIYRSHSDYFGYSVVMGYNAIAVGVPLADVFHPGTGYNTDEGEVFVYRKINGSWERQGVAFAPDGEAGDHFGTSVGLVTNRLVVGSPLDQVGANGAQGSVYVFDVSTDTPAMTAHLTAADGSFGDHFGESLSFTTFYGEYFLVGAPLDDIGSNANQGSAYLFYDNSGVWNQYTKVVAPDGAANDNFGQSVAMTYFGLTVGSPGDDVGANVDQGSVYFYAGLDGILSAHIFDPYGRPFDYFGSSVAMYIRKIVAGAEGFNESRGKALLFEQVNGSWSFIRYLFANGGEPGDAFGHSIGFGNDNIIVGAWQAAVNENISAGSAYIFRLASGNWSAQPTTESGMVAYDAFGYSVALDGNTAIVGVPYSDSGEAENAGRSFIFVRNNGLWSIEAQLIPSDVVGLDLFGNSVSISGDTAVIGAPNKQIGASPAAGNAYIYTRVGGIWSLQSTIVANDAQPNDNFGSSVNIDGNDIVVGAPKKDLGAIGDAGAIYWFARSGNSWAQENEYQDPTANASAFLGRSVAISDNTAVGGEPEQTLSGQVKAGRIFIFERNAGNWSPPTTVTAPTNTANYYFGNAVDIDGDSIIASAFGSISAPSAFVFVRTGPAIWTQQTTFFPPGGPSTASFTASVAIKGDEAAVGIPNWNDYQGDVVVGHRTGENWAAQHLPHPPEGGYFGGHGQSVAVDGSTVIAGFPAASISGSTGAGAAVVSVRDSNGTYAREALLTRSFAGDGAQFGYSVDLDNGIAVVGAPCQLVGSNACQGAAYVLEQVGGLWSATAQITAADGGLGDHFGQGVRISGDTIVASAPSHNSQAGAVYVFVKIGAVWTQQNKIVSPSYNIPNGYFGYSIDLDQDEIVVGAPYANENRGEAYNFHRDNGVWTRVATFGASDTFFYGTSVSISGDYSVVGMVGAQNTDSGKAYLHERTYGTVDDWHSLGPLSITAPIGSYCGQAVSISYESIIVGCPREPINGISSGTVYYFYHFAGNIGPGVRIVPPDAANDDYFGSSLSEKNNVLVIGANSKTINGNYGQGAAYIYYPSQYSIGPPMELIDPNGQAYDNFGFSMAVDGSQMIIGSYGKDVTPYGFRQSNRIAAPTTAGQDRGAMFTYENQYVASPTAAHVPIRGRILNASGNGIGGVVIEIRDENGHIVANGLSNPFGYYGVENIEVGNSYLVTASSKRFVFTNNPRLVSLNDELLDLDFVAESP